MEKDDDYLSIIRDPLMSTIIPMLSLKDRAKLGVLSKSYQYILPSRMFDVEGIIKLLDDLKTKSREWLFRQILMPIITSDESSNATYRIEYIGLKINRIDENSIEIIYPDLYTDYFENLFDINNCISMSNPYDFNLSIYNDNERFLFIYNLINDLIYTYNDKTSNIITLYETDDIFYSPYIDAIYIPTVTTNYYITIDIDKTLSIPQLLNFIDKFYNIPLRRNYDYVLRLINDYSIIKDKILLDDIENYRNKFIQILPKNKYSDLGSNGLSLLFNKISY